LSDAKNEEIGLTPEHLERLRRISLKEKRPIAQVLSDAVLEYWVRFAGRNGLKPEEW
jgi:hypothetical protein